MEDFHLVKDAALCSKCNPNPLLIGSQFGTRLVCLLRLAKSTWYGEEQQLSS